MNVQINTLIRFNRIIYIPGVSDHRSTPLKQKRATIYKRGDGGYYKC